MYYTHTPILLLTLNPSAAEINLLEAAGQECVMPQRVIVTFSKSLVSVEG